MSAANMPIQGIGTVEIDLESAHGINTLKVRDVYYSPGIRINVLSPSVIFSKSGIWGQWGKAITLFNKHNDPIGMAYQVNHLWKLAISSEQGSRNIMAPRALPPNIMSISTNENQEISLWHRRMAHLGYESIKALSALASGIDLTQNALNWKPNGMCEACGLAKSVKRLPKDSQSHADQPIKRLFADYWGPYQSEGLGGKRYYILVECDNTRYLWGTVVNERSAPILINFIEPFIELIEKQINRKILFFRTDNAKEFRSKAF
jgi:GAG-pre-integrase domain